MLHPDPVSKIFFYQCEPLETSSMQEYLTCKSFRNRRDEKNNMPTEHARFTQKRKKAQDDLAGFAAGPFLAHTSQ